MQEPTLAVRPLTINLPDGTKVMSTHTCDITIPGLPKVLVGHVVPKLSIALLIGIRVLCNAGCKVVFTKTKCNVWYKGTVILSGRKDLSTDLLTLPIDASLRTAEPIKKNMVDLRTAEPINKNMVHQSKANLSGKKLRFWLAVPSAVPVHP